MPMPEALRLVQQNRDKAIRQFCDLLQCFWLESPNDTFDEIVTSMYFECVHDLPAGDCNDNEMSAALERLFRAKGHDGEGKLFYGNGVEIGERTPG